jgi:hypothetical protein
MIKSHGLRMALFGYFPLKEVIGSLSSEDSGRTRIAAKSLPSFISQHVRGSHFAREHPPFGRRTGVPASGIEQIRSNTALHDLNYLKKIYADLTF